MSVEPIIVSLSDSREVHVKVSNWKGRGEALDIRTYIKSKNYTGYTQKGVNIPIDKAPLVYAAIGKVLKK